MSSKVSNTLVYLLLSVILLVPEHICKSLCVRPANPGSLYTINPKGSEIGKVLKHISTKVTSEFMIEILSAEAGHMTLLCNQEEWDRMLKDYNNCIHQVQHQLKCGGHGGVCDWVQASVESCTGRVMGQCWTKEATNLLKKRQMEAVSNHPILVNDNCQNLPSNQGLKLLIRNLKKGNFIPKTDKNVISSKLLRLG